MKNLVSVFSFIYYACKILVVVALFNWWIDGAHASEISPLVANKLNEERDLLNQKGDETFEFKQTIYCHDMESGQDPYNPGRGATVFFRCPDLTVTFPQPESTGAAGWNGYCGETAITNITATLCGRFFHPLTVGRYASDITPGTLPSTSLRSLRRIFTENDPNRSEKANPCPAGTWRLFGATSGENFLESLKTALWEGGATAQRRDRDGSLRTFTPVMVLMATSITRIHWVTLVDFTPNGEDKFGCDAVVNTWGHQKVMTCERLVHYGRTLLFGFKYLSFER